MTLLAYARVTQCGFVYDDIPFLLENPTIRQGLSLEGVVWAFSYFGQFNWHPLAWVSHQLDFTLYGARPLGHHLTAVALHAATSVILFLVLRDMTARVWRSALVAALFALHPIHVESVAWVAERKDVLSGLFFVLVLAAYTSFARKPSVGRNLLTLALFGLGLLAKTMLVSVPFLLLLLDVWPLGRTALARGVLPPVGWRRLVLEKVPFLVLSLAGSAAAAIAQGRGGALASLESIPLATRIANALVSYASYVLKLLWPSGLAVFYPYPTEHGPGKVLAAAAMLLLVTAGATLYLRRRPYLLVGWLWFLGMLVPVIGIVQVGSFAMADRYTYLPSIGLFVALCWLVGDLVERHGSAIALAAAAGSAVVLACGALTFVHVGVWRDSLTLFRHALDVTEDNHVAHANLGEALAAQGRVEEAFEHFRRALEIEPDYAIAHGNLGVAALQLGRPELAVEHQLRAVALEPDNAIALSNLGNALAAVARYQEALEALSKARERRPDDVEVRLSRGMVAECLGQEEEGLREYAVAALLAPGDPRPHLRAARVHWKRGRVAETISELELVLVEHPEHVDVLAFLGAARTQEGRLQEAADLLDRARRLAPGRPDVWMGLGQVMGAAGEHEQARLCFERVVQLSPDPEAEYPGFGKDLVGQAELGISQALTLLGRHAQAVDRLRSLLQVEPQPIAALIQLAWLLATSPDETTRDGAEALVLAERACSATNEREPLALDARAAALAELGRFDEAVAELERALVLVQGSGSTAATEALRARQELYRGGQRFRMPIPSSSR